MRNTRLLYAAMLIALAALVAPTSAGNAAEQDVGIGIFNKFQDSVVDILTTVQVESGMSGTGQGCGFFVDKRSTPLITDDNTYVLTAAHVVKELDDKVAGPGMPLKVLNYTYEISIKSKGKKYFAVRIGASMFRDVALLKVLNITKDEYVPAVLGNSDTLRIGQDVFVVGSPFGLSASYSNGAVGQLHRRSEIGLNYFEDFIQLTAPINPGNSGSPLINRQGEVVGVVTAGHVRGQPLNFAVPTAVFNIPKLLKGDEQLPKLGAECLLENFRRFSKLGQTRIQDLIVLYQLLGIDDAGILETIRVLTADLKAPSALVTTLDSKSPAARATIIKIDNTTVTPEEKAKLGVTDGLQRGDLVVTVAGRSVMDGMDVRRAMLDLAELKKPFTIEVWRVTKSGTTRLTLSVTAEEYQLETIG